MLFQGLLPKQRTASEQGRGRGFPAPLYRQRTLWLTSSPKPFLNSQCNNWFKQGLSMGAKTKEQNKGFWEIRLLHGPQVSLHSLLLNYKEKKVPLQSVGLADTYLTKGSNVALPTTEKLTSSASWGDDGKENNVSHLVFLAKKKWLTEIQSWENKTIPQKTGCFTIQVSYLGSSKMSVLKDKRNERQRALDTGS